MSPKDLKCLFFNLRVKKSGLNTAENQEPAEQSYSGDNQYTAADDQYAPGMDQYTAGETQYAPEDTEYQFT